MKLAKFFLAAVAGAGLTLLCLPGTAEAGRYVWVSQGIYSHWEYQPDASDYYYLSNSPGRPQPGRPGGAGGGREGPSLGGTAPAYEYLGNGRWRLQGTNTITREGARMLRSGKVFRNGRWVNP